jgi:hypothetical protein
MDRIVIKNKLIKLDLTTLGDPFTVVPVYGSLNFKFKLYRNKSYSENESFLVIIANETFRGFTVIGSLRKWYFGKNKAVMDFDYKTFRHCIGILSTRLKVHQDDFWESNVTYLEIGGSVKLKRKYDCIIPSMVSYPRLGKGQIKNETVYFKGQNYELIAYDKLKEVFKDRNSNKRIRDILTKGVFILRFEVKLRCPSNTTLKDRVRTLNDIKNNWGFLIEYWKNAYLKIEMVQIQNPTLIPKKQYATRRQLKDYFSVMLIAEIGIDSIYGIINRSVRDKKEERDHFTNLLGKFEANTLSEYHEVVKEAVEQKARIMKRFSSDI